MSRAAREKLRDNLRTVQDRIGAACERSGRHPSDVVLVAVTKTVGPELAGLLPDMGILDLGESRPQELWKKAGSLGEEVRWHLIGHLQRNKVEQTLPRVSLIHAVDSVRLLQALDKEAVKQDRSLDVLLEVNVSGEKSKHGLAPAEWQSWLDPIHQLRKTQVRGLMTMAPLREAEECRPVFVELRELRDRIQGNLTPPHDMIELSMGMSNDFEVAVEEGATLVRLGTILWEGLDP